MTAEGPFVVDANVAVKWFVPEPLSERAVVLLRRTRVFLAPLILPAEFGNVMRKKMLKGEISARQAGEAIAALLDLVELRPVDELVNAAWDITVRHGRTFYDALYVALALREGCKLVTADDRLMRDMGPGFAAMFLPLSEV